MACIGKKISDLDERTSLNGNEFLLFQDNEYNGKIALDTFTEGIANYMEFDATATAVTGDTAAASVTLNDRTFEFEFQLPRGERGNDGTDGSTGTVSKSVVAFTSSEDKPTTPTGGYWDYSNNTLVYPNGWYGSADLDGVVWMSTNTYYADGTIDDWSSPVRITGYDGQAGKDGSTYEYIYTRTTSVDDVPTRPLSSQTEEVPTGWTDNPQGINEYYKVEWVCIRTYDNDTELWSDYTTPVIWSRWGENGADGDGFEYIFTRTSTSAQPEQPTDNSQEDDYIPTQGNNEQPWTDNPTGVDSTYRWEWVSTRKQTNTETSGAVWGTFSVPVLWSYYALDGLDGEDGKDGVDGKDGLDGAAGEQGPEGPAGRPGNGWELRFSLGTSETYNATWNSTVQTTRDPSDYGWSLTQPTTTDDYDTVWFIQSRITYTDNDDETGTLATGNWSTPAVLYGSAGSTGATGAKGQIIYPAGVYTYSTDYVCDEYKAPYVWDSTAPNSNDGYGMYYLLNQQMTWNSDTLVNKTPHEEYDANGSSAAWIPIEGFDAIFTDVAIIDNGTVGSAVFNGNYMFSQNGVDGNGNASSSYENFKEVFLTTYTVTTSAIASYNPDTVAPNPHVVVDTSTNIAYTYLDSQSTELGEYFYPNYWVNLLTGASSNAAGDILFQKYGDLNTTIDWQGSPIKVFAKIGNMYFTEDGIHVGSGYLSESGEHTFISTDGSISNYDDYNDVYNFRLNSDGSGSLARENIVWDSTGKVTGLIWDLEYSSAYPSFAGVVLQLPSIPEGCIKTLVYTHYTPTRAYNGLRFVGANTSDIFEYQSESDSTFNTTTTYCDPVYTETCTTFALVGHNYGDYNNGNSGITHWTIVRINAVTIT